MEKIKEGLEEILYSSARLIAKNGYHGTSMRDLAKGVGRSLSGLYHYFHNKEELLYLINFHGFSSVTKTVYDMLNEIHIVEERLYALILNHLYYFLAHKNEMSVMREGTRVLDPERRRTITQMKKEYNLVGQKIVEAIYKEKMGHPMESQKLERITFLLFGMMNWSFNWYSKERYGDFDTLIDDIYSTFLKGILSENIRFPDKIKIQKIYQKHKNQMF